MRWWFLTRSAIEALTRPHADTNACDDAVEQLARSSWIGAITHRASLVIRSAWATSWTRGAAHAIGSELMPRSDVTAWRIRGWIAVVCGVTVLGLDSVKPTPIGPLSWLLPSLIVAAGLLTMVMASPLARAVADRRERTPRSATS
jgi:hypothetical protein